MDTSSGSTTAVAFLLAAVVFGVFGTLAWRKRRREPMALRVAIMFGIVSIMCAVMPAFFGTGASTVWGSGASEATAGLSAPGRSMDKSAMSAGAMPGPMSGAMPQVESPAPAAAGEATARFIAVKHSLAIEASHTELPKVFTNALAACEKAHCELIEANVNHGSDAEESKAPGNATLIARISPQEIDAFLAAAKGQGKVISHNRESEDKTGQVIDADASIANLINLRDRLRNILAQQAGTMKDILEVERELSRTQTSLDSAQGLRQSLAKQTLMTLVNLRFQEPSAFMRPATGMSQLVLALRQSSSTFLESFASLVRMVAALAPFAIVALMGVGVYSGWQRFRARRRPTGAAAAPLEPRSTEARSDPLP